MRVGFIGLGLMGRPMALNALKGGHVVFVWARRPETMAPLIAAGATACTSAAALAAEVEVLVTVVADGPDVEAVALGDAGIAAGAQPGLLVIDMSTIAPASARKVASGLAARNIDFLDAPVSGGVVGAEAGTLSIMVGGSAEAFARAQPVLQSLGKNIVHVGPSGAGQVAKAANNLVIALTVQGISEAFCLARKSGVDPAKVREALLGGFAASKALEVHGQRLIDRNFKPGFKTWMHQKDLNIALRSAHELNLGLPGTALVTQFMNAAVGMGFGEDDSASLYRVIEAMSGLDGE